MPLIHTTRNDRSLAKSLLGWCFFALAISFGSVAVAQSNFVTPWWRVWEPSCKERTLTQEEAKKIQLMITRVSDMYSGGGAKLEVQAYNGNDAMWLTGVDVVIKFAQTSQEQVYKLGTSEGPAGIILLEPKTTQRLGAVIAAVPKPPGSFSFTNYWGCIYK